MIRAVAEWFRRRQRKFDLRVLWPACLAAARGDGQAAKAAFAMHVFSDPAWTRDFSHEELVRYIDGMPDGCSEVPDNPRAAGGNR